MIDWASVMTEIEEGSGITEPVTYDGNGLVGATVSVVWTDEAAQPDDTGTSTARVLSIEIQKSLLQGKPTKSDRITRRGVMYRVLTSVDRDDIGRWLTYLERA